MREAATAGATGSPSGDDGPPGPRPENGDACYAAVSRDADGHHIEVVTFLAPAYGA